MSLWNTNTETNLTQALYKIPSDHNLPGSKIDSPFCLFWQMTVDHFPKGGFFAITQSVGMTAFNIQQKMKYGSWIFILNFGIMSLIT